MKICPSSSQPLSAPSTETPSTPAPEAAPQAAVAAKSGGWLDATGKQLEHWSGSVIQQSQQEMHQAAATMGRYNPLVGVQQVGATLLEGVVGLAGLAGKAMQDGSGAKLADTLSNPLELARTLAKGLVQGGADAYQNAGPFALAGYVGSFAVGAGGAGKAGGAARSAGELAEAGSTAAEAGRAVATAAEKVVTMDFVSGSVSKALGEMLETANKTGSRVEASLNGVKVIARPGDTLAAVRAPLDARLQAAGAATQTTAAAASSARAAKLDAFTAGGGKVITTAPQGLVTDARGMLPAGGLNAGSEPLHLLTPKQLEGLPKGTQLTSITGEKAVVGVDTLSGDTRGGFVAYGFPESALEPAGGGLAPISIEFTPGAHIDRAVDELVAAAKKQGRPVEGQFNNTRLVANPGESAAQVRKPFDVELTRGIQAAQAREAQAAIARQAQLKVFTDGGGKVITTPPAGLVTDSRGVMPPRSIFNVSEQPLHLLTPEQLKTLPAGTELTGLSGGKVIVGVDTLSDDTRGGFTAYGFSDSALGTSARVGVDAESRVARFANTSHAFGTEGVRGGVEQFSPLAGSNVNQVIADAVKRADKTGVPLEGRFNGVPLKVGPGDTAETVKASFEQARDAQVAEAQAAQAAVVAQRSQAIERFTASGGKLTPRPPADLKLSPQGLRGDDFVTLKRSQVSQLPRGTQLTDVSTGRTLVVGFDTEAIAERMGTSADGFCSLGFKLEDVKGRVTSTPRSLEQILTEARKQARGGESFFQSPEGVAATTLGSGAEIRAFAQHLVDTLAQARADSVLGAGAKPTAAEFASALDNAQYLVSAEHVRAGTESAWRDALAHVRGP